MTTTTTTIPPTATQASLAPPALRRLVAREYREQRPVAVRAVAWNPLGNRVATATAASAAAVRVWNPERADVRYSTELRQHSTAAGGGGGGGGGADAIAWDPTLSDRLCVCATAAGTVRLWDVRANTCLASTSSATLMPAAAIYAPDGSVIAIMPARGGRTIMFLDAKSLQPAGKPYLDPDQSAGDFTVAVFAFTTDRVVLVVGLSSGILRFVHVGGGPGDQPKVLASVPAHRAAITAAQFDPLGRYLAVGSADSLVSIWQLHDLSCLRTITFASASSFPVRALSFSFDGAFLAVVFIPDRPTPASSNNGSNNIYVASVESGNQVHAFPLRSAVTDLQWHPSKYWLAYAGDPAGLKILATPPSLPSHDRQSKN
ncbi:WD40-repeat-containing domain protein [Lipomyces japonicus]|uniref:WD40-repeat-containing domain protein n=1 Tax=Lipomyces japonicus TaxID=56871 RepID=UPI0034CEB636